MKHAPMVITPAKLAAQAANRWHRQWEHYVDLSGDKSRTEAALRALGPTPTPAEVDAVIGNRSWTSAPVCDCCGTHGLPLIIRLGEPPDVESRTLHVCPECLLEAANLGAKALLDQAAEMLRDAAVRP